MFFGVQCAPCCPCKYDKLLPCRITLVHVDENRCEDDAFALYIKNPTTGAERFVRELDLASTPPGCCNANCPQTRIEVPINLSADDVGFGCRFAVVLKFVRANCCGTLSRLTVFGETGAFVVGESFGSSGYEETFTVSTVCVENPLP